MEAVRVVLRVMAVGMEEEELAVVAMAVVAPAVAATVAVAMEVAVGGVEVLLVGRPEVATDCGQRS